MHSKLMVYSHCPNRDRNLGRDWGRWIRYRTQWHRSLSRPLSRSLCTPSHNPVQPNFYRSRSRSRSLSVWATHNNKKYYLTDCDTEDRDAVCSTILSHQCYDASHICCQSCKKFNVAHLYGKSLQGKCSFHIYEHDLLYCKKELQLKF